MGHFKADPLPRYRYAALKGPNSIRLLQLQPLSETLFKVSCRILEDDIANLTQPYVALSYVWGDSSSRIPILLDDHLATVTINLYEALIQLQNTFPTLTIWIDALCIDQTNPYERNHQVAQMRSIYSKAYRTITWLGPHEDGTEPLFHFIKDHSKKCLQSQHILSDRPRSVSPTRSVTPPQSKSRPRSNSRSKSLHPPVSLGAPPAEEIKRPRSAHEHRRRACPFDVDLLRAVQRIEQQPYWNRVWIIQEIVVANKVILMCGRQTLEWPLFIDFLRLLSNDHFAIPYLDTQHGLSRDFACSRRSFILRLSRWPKTIDLAHALDWSSTSHATDVRDKVYALLGLVNTGEGTTLVPDYSVSACIVFCLALRSMVRDWHSLLSSHPAFSSDHVTSYSRKISFEVRCLTDTCLSNAWSHLRDRQNDPIPKEGASCSSSCDGRECGSEKAMWSMAGLNKLVFVKESNKDTRATNLLRIASDMPQHVFWDRAGSFYLPPAKFRNSKNPTQRKEISSRTFEGAPKKSTSHKSTDGTQDKKGKKAVEQYSLDRDAVTKVLFFSEPSHRFASRRIIIPKPSKTDPSSTESDCSVCEQNSYMRARLLSKRRPDYSGFRCGACGRLWRSGPFPTGSSAKANLSNEPSEPNADSESKVHSLSIPSHKLFADLMGTCRDCDTAFSDSRVEFATFDAPTHVKCSGCEERWYCFEDAFDVASFAPLVALPYDVDADELVSSSEDALPSVVGKSLASVS